MANRKEGGPEKKTHNIMDEARYDKRTAELKKANQRLKREIAIREQIEGALRESEEKYRSLLDLIPDPVVIAQDDQYRLVNKSFTEVFGVSQDDVDNGLSSFNFVQEKDRKALRKKYEDRLGGKRLPRYDCADLVARDGKIITCETSAAIINYDARPAVLLILRDISERRRAEEALRESEEKYRTLVELSPDPVVILQDEVYKFINPAFTELFGYDSQDIENLTFLDLIQEYDKTMASQQYYDRLSGEKILKSFVIDLVAKDGRKITCEASATRIQYNGRPAFLATMRDITVRRQAEEALRISEERLALVMEATRDGIWDWDITNSKGYFSPRCVEITGIPLSDLTLDTWLSRIHPDDYASFSEKLKYQLEDYEPFSAEYRLRLEDGTYRWQNTHGIVVFDEDNKAKRIVGSLRDVTDAKHAEEALRESEKRLRQLADATWEAIAIHDRGTLLHANSQYYEMFGYEQGELLGKQALLKMVTPESADYMRKHIDLDWSETYEVVGRRKDGTELPIEIRGKTMDYYGRTVRVAAIRDLTERKKTEAALRESEELYRLLFENTGTGIYVFDSNGVCQMANKKAASDFRGIPEDFIGKSFSDFPLESADQYFERIRQIVSSGEGKVFEESLTLPPGKKRWILSNAQPVTDAKGNVFAVQVITQDITERKKAEEQIHTLTQQLIGAQEIERQRISLELHDRVAQDLSTSKIACELLQDNPSLDENARQSASKISKALHSTITAVRDLSYELRPPGIAELGLIRTVFQYCKDFSRKTGVNVDFHSAGMDNLDLDFNTEINLYRVIQEGLNNIGKHADAKDVIIRIISSFPSIIIRIEDNGRGFDVEKRLITALNEKRMGLRSIEERVKLLQGTLSIQSRQGEGTKILVEVPCNGEKSRDKGTHIGRR